MENYQGVAVMNYTDSETPYTRIIEHKHFEFGNQLYTYITKEYPVEWVAGIEPYYPVNNKKNQQIFNLYQQRANQENNVYFGGRLAEYKYYDMDKTIASALELVSRIL
jgi:UDP-galactopyranose mutase